MQSFSLPTDYKPYIDKYFLRAKEILQKANLNPKVKAQIFIRKGLVNVYGIDKVIAMLTKYSDIEKTGHIYTLKEGEFFEPNETLMVIKAPIQSIIDLETMYLGILSSETTLHNDNEDISLIDIENTTKEIVDLIKPRPVIYFGARHWSYERDYDIAVACNRAGAAGCSTDRGAQAWGTEGIGTIPHALETIYHWKYGLENAVMQATVAFDTFMDKSIPRVALVDYANKEIRDTLFTAKCLGTSLNGIRIDTCGENFMEESPHWEVDNSEKFKYWFNKGVCVWGVMRLVNMMRQKYSSLNIMLSSGFGNIQKVKTFVEAEKELGVRLFDSLGVGGLYHSRMATMDIIQVEDREIHKIGRPYRPNKRLQKIF